MTHLDKTLYAAKGMFGLLLAVQSIGHAALDAGLPTGSLDPGVEVFSFTFG